MADWFDLKSGEPLPTVPRYLVLAGDASRTRSARYFQNLTKVKSAITNSFAWGEGANFVCDVWVYEWDGTGWQEIYFMPMRTPKKDHVLWKGVAPKTPQVISEVDVDAAVASILGTNSQED